MLIRAGYKIEIECEAETPLMALLSVHPSRAADLRTPAVITSNGPARLSASFDEFGNVRTRTVAPNGTITLSTDFVSPAPMDFSAWFEVFLSGRWYTFDARHNVPRVGRILMARGRDAADCAITTTFGGSKLVEFKIVTEEVPAMSLAA